MDNKIYIRLFVEFINSQLFVEHRGRYSILAKRYEHARGPRKVFEEVHGFATLHTPFTKILAGLTKARSISSRDREALKTMNDIWLHLLVDFNNFIKNKEENRKQKVRVDNIDALYNYANIDYQNFYNTTVGIHQKITTGKGVMEQMKQMNIHTHEMSKITKPQT